MSDIVKRLREYTHWDLTKECQDMMHEAADEIERLRPTKVPKGYTAEELDECNPYTQWMRDE
jgi:hypothetical protein